MAMAYYKSVNRTVGERRKTIAIGDWCIILEDISSPQLVELDIAGLGKTCRALFWLSN